MLSPKEAVEVATTHLREFFTEGSTRHFRVEEIKTDGEHWLITFGWVEPASREIGSTILPMQPTVQRLPRVYKRVRIAADTGQFIALERPEFDDD